MTETAPPLPCPFCGAEMERMAHLWLHPDHACTLRHHCLNRDSLASWNRRAPPDAAMAEALREISESHIPSMPMTAADDELAWAQKHVAHLRRIALKAISGEPT